MKESICLKYQYNYFLKFQKLMRNSKETHSKRTDLYILEPYPYLLNLLNQKSHHHIRYIYKIFTLLCLRQEILTYNLRF